MVLTSQVSDTENVLANIETQSAKSSSSSSTSQATKTAPESGAVKSPARPPPPPPPSRGSTSRTPKPDTLEESVYSNSATYTNSISTPQRPPPLAPPTNSIPSNSTQTSSDAVPNFLKPLPDSASAMLQNVITGSLTQSSSSSSSSFFTSGLATTSSHSVHQSSSSQGSSSSHLLQAPSSSLNASSHSSSSASPISLSPKLPPKPVPVYANPQAPVNKNNNIVYQSAQSIQPSLIAPTKPPKGYGQSSGNSLASSSHSWSSSLSTPDPTSLPPASSSHSSSVRPSLAPASSSYSSLSAPSSSSSSSSYPTSLPAAPLPQASSSSSSSSFHSTAPSSSAPQQIYKTRDKNNVLAVQACSSTLDNYRDRVMSFMTSEGRPMTEHEQSLLKDEIMNDALLIITLSDNSSQLVENLQVRTSHAHYL
jgi:hypothetical protein